MGIWIAYVTKADGKQADEEMYKILRAVYGDGELATMLAGSKQYFTGREEIQHKVWVKTAKTIITALKLNTQGDHLLESPAFRSWATYVAKLSPQNADELMFSALKTIQRRNFGQNVYRGERERDH